MSSPRPVRRCVCLINDRKAVEVPGNADIGVSVRAEPGAPKPLSSKDSRMRTPLSGVAKMQNQSPGSLDL